MKVRNLALGKSVEITAFAPIKHSYALFESGEASLLTDGIISDPSCHRNGFVCFYHGIGRTLFVDLGDVYAVSGFDVGFVHNRTIGACCPESVRLLLSENGVDYFECASVPAPYPASFGMIARAVYSSDFNIPLRARFAKIEFEVENGAFCDEIRIFGRESDGNEDALYGKIAKDNFKRRFADRETLCGTHDISIFCYGGSRERAIRIEKEDFFPHIAYLDENGIPRDIMFDALIIKPFAVSFEEQNDLSYWGFLLDELFSPSANLRALENAVCEIKQALKLPKDYKYKVHLSSPIPKISLSPFGDLNGDGISEKLLSTEDCVKAFAWFVDEATRRFNAECFNHIAIDGWFWDNGAFDRYDREDEELFASSCVEKLKKRGYKCLASPSYQAGGVEKAERIGFDCVAMRPINPSSGFPCRDTNKMLAEYAFTCKKYGFACELELDGQILDEENCEEYIELFSHYLRAYMHNGMMTETIHVYDYNSRFNIISECAGASKACLRTVYDWVYKFIKGILKDSDLQNEEEVTLAYAESIEEVPSPAKESVVELGEKVKSVANDKNSECRRSKKKIKRTENKKKQSPKIRKYANAATIAAAALGAIYLIKKLKDEKD